MEAKFLNLPIIASEKDYVRDILDPVETFDPNCPHSISRAVKRFLKIPDTKTVINTSSDFINELLNLKNNIN